MTIVKTFKVIESSTKNTRPQFDKMLQFIEAQKEKIHLVVDCVDRLQRGFRHTAILNEIINKDLLEIHFVREGNIVGKNANSMQNMQWNLGVIIAQTYTDQLSDNVKRSIDQKLKQGEWIAQAPIGYLNTIDVKH